MKDQRPSFTPPIRRQLHPYATFPLTQLSLRPASIYPHITSFRVPTAAFCSLSLCSAWLLTNIHTSIHPYIHHSSIRSIYCCARRVFCSLSLDSAQLPASIHLSAHHFHSVRSPRPIAHFPLTQLSLRPASIYPLISSFRALTASFCSLSLCSAWLLTNIHSFIHSSIHPSSIRSIYCCASRVFCSLSLDSAQLPASIHLSALISSFRALTASFCSLSLCSAWLLTNIYSSIHSSSIRFATNYIGHIFGHTRA